MNAYLQADSEPESDLSRQIAEGMLRAIEKNYGRLLATARKQWERKYAGLDPADSCVIVRISTGELRDFSRMLPLGSGRALESFVTN
jgi:hypothetical protein